MNLVLNVSKVFDVKYDTYFNYVDAAKEKCRRVIFSSSLGFSMVHK